MSSFLLLIIHIKFFHSHYLYFYTIYSFSLLFQLRHHRTIKMIKMCVKIRTICIASQFKIHIASSKHREEVEDHLRSSQVSLLTHLLDWWWQKKLSIKFSFSKIDFYDRLNRFTKGRRAHQTHPRTKTKWVMKTINSRSIWIIQRLIEWNIFDLVMFRGSTRRRKRLKTEKNCDAKRWKKSRTFDEEIASSSAKKNDEK